MTRPRLVVTAAIVERDGAFLVTRRPDGTHLEGHWEFPGGKCEPGETLAECLLREMLENEVVEFGIDLLWQLGCQFLLGHTFFEWEALVVSRQRLQNSGLQRVKSSRMKHPPIFPIVKKHLFLADKVLQQFLECFLG